MYLLPTTKKEKQLLHEPKISNACRFTFMWASKSTHRRKRKERTLMLSVRRGRERTV